MKTATKISTVVLLVALAGGWAHTQQSAATARQALAVSWDVSSADYAATGWRGDTLFVALPNENNCGAMLDSITTDEKVSRELQAVGFENLKCGTTTTRLGQN
jgi:hypothetical protein